MCIRDSLDGELHTFLQREILVGFLPQVFDAFPVNRVDKHHVEHDVPLAQPCGIKQRAVVGRNFRRVHVGFCRAKTGYRLDEEARNIRLPQLKLDSDVYKRQIGTP